MKGVEADNLADILDADKVSAERRRRANDYEYRKARREAAEANGLCGVCCKRKHLPGSYRCEPCAEYLRNHSRATMRTRRARDPIAPRVTRVSDWCIECQACGFHRDGCPVEIARAA